MGRRSAERASRNRSFVERGNASPPGWMSIYEDASDAEKGGGAAELQVPDYTDPANASGGGGSEMMPGGKDYETKTDKRPLIAIAAVAIVGYLLYSKPWDDGSGTAQTNDYDYQAPTPTYQAPPPPPTYRPPPPPPVFYPPPPPPPLGCTAQPPRPNNGYYTVQPGGTTATLQCNSGYRPSGVTTIYCTNNFWNGAGTCTASQPVQSGNGGTGVVVPGARSGQHGRFVAVNTALHWDQAKEYCERTFPGGTLASIHSKEEQKDADDACREMPLSTDWDDSNQGHPHACWIGMYEDHAQGGFVWADESPVTFLNFHAGEPNNDARITEAGHEEDKVEINFAGWGGAWNDNHNEGAAGFTHHAASCADGSCDSNAEGMYPVCQTEAWSRVGGMTGDGGVVPSTVFVPPTRVTVDRFVALPVAYDMEAADEQCKAELGPSAGLASIHSAEDQRNAASACDQLVMKEEEAGVPHGCWIGFRRVGPTVWSWKDGTTVDYQNWAPGEPNDYRSADTTSHSSSHGEEAVEMDFRASLSGNTARAGGWNDNSIYGQAGHTADQAPAWGTLAVFGAFPLCQSYTPAQTPSNGGKLNVICSHEQQACPGLTPLLHAQAR